MGLEGRGEGFNPNGFITNTVGLLSFYILLYSLLKFGLTIIYGLLVCYYYIWSIVYDQLSSGDASALRAGHNMLKNRLEFHIQEAVGVGTLWSTTLLLKISCKSPIWKNFQLEAPFNDLHNRIHYKCAIILQDNGRRGAKTQTQWSKTNFLKNLQRDPQNTCNWLSSVFKKKSVQIFALGTKSSDSYKIEPKSFF